MSDIGAVQQVDIDNEMREAYLDYAMSVIVACLARCSGWTEARSPTHPVCHA